TAVAVSTGPFWRPHPAYLFLSDAQAGYAISAKIHLEYSIIDTPSHRPGISRESFSHTNSFLLKPQKSFGHHSPHLVYLIVFDRRQCFGKRSRTDLIAACRHCHRESLMRAFIVINMTIRIKLLLNMLQIAKSV